jgi:integrase
MAIGMRQTITDDTSKEKEKILSDPLIMKWLADVPNKKSAQLYRYGVRVFFAWLGESPSEFLKVVKADSLANPEDYQHLARVKLNEFYKYATEEMPRQSKQGAVNSKGVSYNAAVAITTAVRSFLAQYGVSVKFGRRHRPKRTEADPFRRMELSPAHIRAMLANARTPKDRAIILVLAQSGMDISTLCSLRFKQVKDYLASDEVPAILYLARRKTGMQYYTFIAKDALDALKAYVADLKQRKIELQPDDPLWVSERGKHAIRPANVQRTMRRIAIGSGVIDKDLAFNIAGGHSIREWFSSTLLNEGKMQRDHIDWLLGHEQGDMGEAYFKNNKAVVVAEYTRCMEMGLLSIIAKSPINGEALKLAKDAEQKIEALQTEITRLGIENGGLIVHTRELDEKIEQLTETLKHGAEQTVELEEQQRQAADLSWRLLKYLNERDPELKEKFSDLDLRQ